MATKYVILRGTVSGALMQTLKIATEQQAEWDFWVKQVEVDEFRVSLSKPGDGEYVEENVCNFEEFLRTLFLEGVI